MRGLLNRVGTVRWPEVRPNGVEEAVQSVDEFPANRFRYLARLNKNPYPFEELAHRLVPVGWLFGVRSHDRNRHTVLFQRNVGDPSNRVASHGLRRVVRDLDHQVPGRSPVGSH